MPRRKTLFLFTKPTVAPDGTRVYPPRTVERAGKLATQGYTGARELARVRAGGHVDVNDVLLWLWKGPPNESAHG